MNYSPLIQQLIDAFRRLPGVGNKSAQRMWLHFWNVTGGRTQTAAALVAAEWHRPLCQCRTLSEHTLFHICANSGRDQTTVCVSKLLQMSWL